MADDDIVRSILDQQNKAAQGATRDLPADNAPIATVQPASGKGQGRVFLQGMTFGGADEAEAYLRSWLYGVDYEKELASIREKLSKARKDSPVQSLVSEVAGAAIPSIIAGLFTGGAGTVASTARFFPTLAKIAALGAAEGGTYAFLSSSDGFKNRAFAMPMGAGLGFVGGAGGYAASRAASRTLGGLVDYVSRKAGRKASKTVEKEIKRVIDDSGMSFEDVMARVEGGERIAEMSPMLASVARGYVAQSRKAARVLQDVYKSRPAELRKETLDYLTDVLAGPGDDNILKRMAQSTDDLKTSASAEYNAVFNRAGPVGDDVIEGLGDALRRVPSAAEEASKLYRAETGKAPFFRIMDGDPVFDRQPTLRDAEIIRRGIKSAADREFSSGSGTVGGAIKDVERGVRGRIDATSPDLAAVRQRWSRIESAKDAFDLGRKALARSPEEVALEFEEMARKGDEFVAAYRQGTLSAFKRRASTGSGKSLPGRMVDPERKENQILEIVAPGDQVESLMGRASTAARAQSASNQILGGSPTQITAGRQAQTASGLMGDVVEAAGSNPMAYVRLAERAVKAAKPSLNDKDVTALARIMVEGNPEILKRALTDQNALAKLGTIARMTVESFEAPSGAVAAAAAIPSTKMMLGPR